MRITSVLRRRAWWHGRATRHHLFQRGT
ncbi:hypothetical protein FQN60_012848, partial [Etheostoma spectabile]